MTRVRRTFRRAEGRAVRTARIVVPAALREIVYDFPVNRLET